MVIVPVRVRIREVEAESQEEVVKKVTEETEYFDLYRAAIERNFQPHFPITYTELAEDEPLPAVLVDEIGDEEFLNSQWFENLGDSEMVPMRLQPEKNKPVANSGNYADHGSHALEAFLSVADATGEMETDLIDLLTALRYLAKQEEIDFETVIRSSEIHFEAETA